VRPRLPAARLWPDVSRRPADGNSQRGQHITPGAVLVFKLELLKLLGPGQPAKEL